MRLRYVEPNDKLGEPDLIIIPGSKTTVADLEYLRRVGLAEEITTLYRRGTHVIGICGGFQMLGERILDPKGVESPHREIEGLGLLPVTTVFEDSKETHRVRGTVTEAPGLLSGACGLPVEGYEIHMGRSIFADAGPAGQGNRAPFHLEERSGKSWDQFDGAIDPCGRVMGTYIHGLFYNLGLRRVILRRLAEEKGVVLPEGEALQSRDEEYDKLAGLVRGSLNMDMVYRMSGLEIPSY